MQLERIEETYRGETPVRTVPASSLNHALAACLQMDDSAKIEIHVVERQPLLTVDQRLVNLSTSFLAMSACLTTSR